MTSRREAVSLQREVRMASISQNVRGRSHGIHFRTQDTLQKILLENLLNAESEHVRTFSLGATEVPWRISREDALVYRNFFARCLQGTWEVTYDLVQGDYKFEFMRV